MKIMRRLATLIGLTLAVIVGASIPAYALFSDSVSLPGTSITTVTVARPTSVSVSITRCHPVKGTNVTVTWVGSGTKGVTGYRVMAHLGNGQSIVMGETAAGTTTFDGNLSVSSMDAQPRLSVIALTSYGWTAQSAKTGIIAC
ncbi:MAG: hypothetical protein JWP40_3082 [Blastococcus sp.]|nr:hypothetical protein [Blastococcus sp.]